MKTREQIISENRIEKLMEMDGVKLIQSPGGWKARCCFHDDKNPSMTIDSAKGLFHCHGCKAGGSVIDYVARRDGISIPDALKLLAGEQAEPYRPLATPAKAATAPSHAPKGAIVATYSYKDEMGTELYQVVRMDPKDFRQRHQESGQWVWTMANVRRVLYNLPHIIKPSTPYVWVVEGEKDCENLKRCGFVGTTNVGGAGKWMDGYSECLAGKEVILCGDNDEPGQAHVAKVLEAVCKKAKTVRVVQIPGPHKDVSDFIATFGENTDAAAKALFELFESASVLTGGVVVPVQSMAELEREYAAFVKECNTSMLNLGKWLPTLGLHVRGLVPGELVMMLADTGVGKTACLQNIAVHAAPVQTLLFELELPGTLTFERFVSMAEQIPGGEIFTTYKKGETVDWRTARNLDHISVCSKSRLTPQDIEKIILQTELKTGHRPKLVLLDYIGLVQGVGKSRYEKISSVAEEMKVIAKSTKTIIVIASQISRKDDEEPEIFLHDAKDSGSIENSAGLVLGLWRDPQDASCLKVKVLKNTKGKPGAIVNCNFNGLTMTITEKSPIDPKDYPQ